MGTLLESARKGKNRKGKNDLINYLTGKTITRSQAIRAHCYDCNGMGELTDCDNTECSLYPFSPYNKLKQNDRLETPAPCKHSQSSVECCSAAF